MSKYRVNQYGHVYCYEGASRTGLHVGRVLPGETKLQAIQRIKQNYSEIEKMESAGILPEDFEAAEEYEEDLAEKVKEYEEELAEEYAEEAAEKYAEDLAEKVKEYAEELAEKYAEDQAE